MNSVASEPKLIGIDWGTSTLRAYLLSAQGVVLDKLHSTDGIMQIKNNDFEATLIRLLKPWLAKSNLPILASGMITSRNGWVETPYLPLPASANHLAASIEALSTSNGVDVYFVTGVTTQCDGAPDVMRGEETQIIGVVESGLANAVMVLPGTHSKWVTVRDGHIDTFATFMSGEVFAALSEHTILGKLMKDAPFDKQGFCQGVAHGFNAGTRLLHKLFQARTLPLFELLDEEQVSDYLSGMLIGAEICGATDKGVEIDTITIVGNHSLADRYAIAFQSLNQQFSLADDDVVARGHFAIAKSAKLV